MKELEQAVAAYNAAPGSPTYFSSLTEMIGGDDGVAATLNRITKAKTVIFSNNDAAMMTTGFADCLAEVIYIDAVVAGLTRGEPRPIDVMLLRKGANKLEAYVNKIRTN